MEKQPLETQTLYAELVERLLAHDASRAIGSVPGSFVKKTIKGREYYYFQHVGPGDQKQQYYIGLRDEGTDALVERYASHRALETKDDKALQRLAAQLRVGGAHTTEASAARVIRALSDAGVFRLGGVLVGTHAFTTIGNSLGVNWYGAALKTLDIDVAASRLIDIATDERADVPAILESLEMGFLPVPRLNPLDPTTSFMVRGQAIRLDLLTPASSEGRPISIHRLAAAAQPLKYLDYVIESPMRAAVINGGATLVNVPDPARFALHKLIVATKRPASEHTKRDKDLSQAAQVLAFLVEERPGDIAIAYEAAATRGAAWIKRLETGRRALRRKDDALAAELDVLLGG